MLATTVYFISALATLNAGIGSSFKVEEQNIKLDNYNTNAVQQREKFCSTRNPTIPLHKPDIGTYTPIFELTCEDLELSDQKELTLPERLIQKKESLQYRKALSQIKYDFANSFNFLLQSDRDHFFAENEIDKIMGKRLNKPIWIKNDNFYKEMRIPVDTNLDHLKGTPLYDLLQNILKYQSIIKRNSLRWDDTKRGEHYTMQRMEETYVNSYPTTGPIIVLRYVFPRILNSDKDQYGRTFQELKNHALTDCVDIEVQTNKFLFPEK